MSARCDEGRVILADVVPIHEVDHVRELLLEHPDAPLDLGGVVRLHTAVLQVLLASGRTVATPPPDPRLAALLAPR